MVTPLLFNIQLQMFTAGYIDFQNLAIHLKSMTHAFMLSTARLLFHTNGSQTTSIMIANMQF